MILGVDPGLSGALAFLHGNSLTIFDVPTLKAGTGGKRVVDEHELARIVDAQNGPGLVSHAFIEQVGAMPGQGVTSMFTFGTTYGLLRGVIAANHIPRTFVTPQKWKKALGVPASKDGARARASQLMPQHANLWARVKDDGRAESALIAYYGAYHAAAGFQHSHHSDQGSDSRELSGGCSGQAVERHAAPIPGFPLFDLRD